MSKLLAKVCRQLLTTSQGERPTTQEFCAWHVTAHGTGMPCLSAAAIGGDSALEKKRKDYAFRRQFY